MTASVSGFDSARPSAPGQVTSGSGSHVPAYVSRLELRLRSMSRQIRPTVTVSHPRRSFVSPGSRRWRRIHASWTASSASVIEPSIR